MTVELPPGDLPASNPPRDAGSAATVAEETAVSTASQRRLVWWRFRKHRLAMVGLVVTIGFYFVAVFAEFLAPYSAGRFESQYTFAPPQRVHVGETGDGWGLYVNDYEIDRDPETFAPIFRADEEQKVSIGLFVRGEPYELFGLIEWDRHLIGPTDPDGPPVYLLGADRLGRDLLSRVIFATRVSMSIGLVGVAIAFALGVAVGGVSGYFGGWVDTLSQRVVEILIALPTLPLWMGLAAAIPRGWGPLARYFAITVVLAMIAWTALAREVRGRFLTLRSEDFVTAARLDGARQPRVIFGHMLPSLTSHLIATLTLSIPAMILAETALSFLGLGLQAPVVSWGVLLQDAQNISVIASSSWLLLPGAGVVVAVLALNFLGDGLRDAADPYRAVSRGAA